MLVMDRKNWMILFGAGLMLLFLGLYYVYKAPIFLFNITLGALALIYGYYIKDKEIKVSLSYSVASFSVNIIQWLMVYSFYYSPAHQSIQFNMALGVAILTTLFLINRLHKNYLETHENINETDKLLNDPKKLTLLIIGLIIMIGSLAGFIAYHTFTLLYIATFGLTAFVYGYYHENGKINVSIKYVEIMSATILLQWIVMFIVMFGIANQMFNEITAQDLALLAQFTMLIGTAFIVQFKTSQVSFSDLIADLILD
jgi:hypothetical protein